MTMQFRQVADNVVAIRFSGWVDDSQVIQAVEYWRQYHLHTHYVILYMVDIMIPVNWARAESIVSLLRDMLATPSLRRVVMIVPSEHPLRTTIASDYADYVDKLTFARSPLEALDLVQTAINHS